MNQKQQIPTTDLHSKQTQFDEESLAASFVEMIADLPERPHPRHVWDNAGRTAYRGGKLFSSMRSVIDAAFLTRNTRIIESTAERVHLHAAHLERSVMDRYYRWVDGSLSLATAVREAAVSAGEMSSAITAIALHQQMDHAALDEFIRVIDQKMLRLTMLRSALMKRYRTPTLRRRISA